MNPGAGSLSSSKKSLRSAIASPSLLQRLWKPGVLLVALLFSLPVFTIASFVVYPSNEIWQHLLDTVLAEYLTNSLLLMTGVAVGIVLLLTVGRGCAYCLIYCLRSSDFITLPYGE